MKRAGKRRYGGLWSEVENNFTSGQDHYPSDLTNTYNLLLNYRAAPAPGQRPPRCDRPNDGETSRVTFLQDGSIPGIDGETHTLSSVLPATRKGTMPAPTTKTKPLRVCRCYRWRLSTTATTLTRAHSLFESSTSNMRSVSLRQPDTISSRQPGYSSIADRRCPCSKTGTSCPTFGQAQGPCAYTQMVARNCPPRWAL
jgi:hypothetical protein